MWIMREERVSDIPDYSWGMCKAQSRLKHIFLLKSVKAGNAGINSSGQKGRKRREEVLSTFINFMQKPLINQGTLDHPGNPGRGGL